MNGFSNGCIVRKILAALLLILNFHHFQLLNSRSKQKGKPPFFFCIILVETISVMWGYDSPHFLTRFILKELEEKLWINIIFGCTVCCNMGKCQRPTEFDSLESDLASWVIWAVLVGCSLGTVSGSDNFMARHNPPLLQYEMHGSIRGSWVCNQSVWTVNFSSASFAVRTFLV